MTETEQALAEAVTSITEAVAAIHELVKLQDELLRDLRMELELHQFFPTP